MYILGCSNNYNKYLGRNISILSPKGLMVIKISVCIPIENVFFFRTALS